MRCRQCGQVNAADARFCNQCGAGLADAAAAERRQLTVMFCDLVGSTSLSERLDPEDLREVIGAYQAVAAEAISRHDGHIAQYLGDGLLVYFGYPQAHEDDARRSVHAALGVVAGLRQLNSGRKHAELAVRIGIHTGPVVVGEVGGGARREHLALGETPNLAARLQGQAEPGTVVVSAATHRLLAGAFAVRALGAKTVKGLAAPVEAWQVIGEASAHGDDPDKLLVGRERELARLRGLWRAAALGRGQGVLIRGEPGIGKTRLAAALRDEVRHAGNVWFGSRCSPYHSTSAFHPVIELFERTAGIGREEAAEGKFAKLQAVVAQLGSVAGEVLVPLALLLSIPLPQDMAVPMLSPQAGRERTFEALIATLRAVAARGPVLLVVEDVHWADPSTLDLLQRLEGRIGNDRLLLLLTSRSDLRPPWQDSGSFPEMSLGPCASGEAQAIVAAVAGAKTLPAGAVERIVARAEGIPLFIEEFTRAALDGADAEPSTIPATLQDLLMARLDRLGPAKSVLQQAAVVGRRFTFELLREVCGLEPAPLAEALSRCVGAHLLAERGDGTQRGYAFRHALLQDAAYQSLLRSARQLCHRRVAEAIATKAPATVEAEPELLAFHYSEASMPAEAAGYWLRAGEHALVRSACQEAIAHAERGIAQVRKLPLDEARREIELNLELVLALALMALRGNSAPEVEQAYARCRALCEGGGPTPKLAIPLWGLWGYSLVRGRLAEAHGLAMELGRLAGATAHPGAALVAAETLGMTLFYTGDLSAARAQFARGLELYKAPKRAVRAERGVHQPGVMCHAFDMLACWLTGLPDQALDAAVRLQALSRALTPFDVAFASCAAAVLRQFLRDPAAVRAASEAAVTIATVQGFAAWRAMGTVLHGWAMSREGESEGGLERMHRGYADWCAIGAYNLRPYFLALLGDACIIAGRHAEAARALQAALEASAVSGERWWEAEIHRLHGEATAALNPSDRGVAEAAFRRAISIAAAQGARAWQLRAATSLARSLAARGEPEQAREVLAGLLGSFVEVLATPDCAEARILLAGLGK